MRNEKHWSVTIEVDGERILTISSSELAGAPDLEKYDEEMRTASEHLASFIGEKKTYDDGKRYTIDDEDGIPF